MKALSSILLIAFCCSCAPSSAFVSQSAKRQPSVTRHLLQRSSQHHARLIQTHQHAVKDDTLVKEKVEQDNENEMGANVNGAKVNGSKLSSVKVNGEQAPTKEPQSTSTSTSSSSDEKTAEASSVNDIYMAADEVTEFIEELNTRFTTDTAKFLKNITQDMEDKLVGLPSQSTNDLSKILTDMTRDIQRAQQRELERQLKAIEKKLVEPLEDLAFGDVPLLDSAKAKSKKSETSKNPNATDDLEKHELILIGKNSTLALTSRKKTAELISNWNVAPAYYSIALLSRWVRNLSVDLLAQYWTKTGVRRQCRTQKWSIGRNGRKDAVRLEADWGNCRQGTRGQKVGHYATIGGNLGLLLLLLPQRSTHYGQV